MPSLKKKNTSSVKTKRCSRQLPIVTLTGERFNGRILIRVNATKVWLTPLDFRRIIHLIIARGKPGTGFVRGSLFYAEAIRRLRKAFNVAGPGTGGKLIETGVGEEYRWSSLRLVKVGPGLEELVATSAITSDSLTALIRA